ncbi:hypothetical protein IG193_05950 [Infirmifilum lucidum]|uniref:Uncharacterized protein n=1 Tax=Infirmifilum lucidum TaxID=2776706 RepID=A0A7L9FF47_9CREN|nr:tagaturonate epimerase family protein [Infirmifilum lucidum]QOJ78307.1 hypothetical protein IG193_05950 [Infirmifilum lucidum]
MSRIPDYLGKMPHLSVGVRIPEIFLEGILEGFKQEESIGGVMLSYHRETAPEYVINAPPGTYEITRGHTGTSIRKYIELSVARAREKGVAIEVEADHVSVTVSSTEAVRRIVGGGPQRTLSSDDLSKALQYIRDEIREAAETRSINFFTIDTCDLIDYGADELSDEEVDTLFRDYIGDSSIVGRYTSVDVDLEGFRLKFSELDAKRVALKLYRSIEAVERVYRIIKEEVPWEFGVEIAFDETPKTTDPRELFFVLQEVTSRGIPVDFIAPNVGFKKREDYEGDLEGLYSRVKTYSKISSLFGILLSFHSGSGSSPFSMKGPGVHNAIREATEGLFKYKVSGVYFELLVHLMSAHSSPRVRRFFEEMYEDILSFLERQVQSRGELYDRTLESLYEEHLRLSQSRGKRLVDTPLFRHYSFIALSLRRDGRRYIRDGIIELYQEEPEFRVTVDRELSRLTSQLIKSLGFSGNAALVQAHKYLTRNKR